MRPKSIPRGGIDFGRTITHRNPGNSPNSRWPCRDASALDGIVVVVFINSKGKINIFCLKVLNLKGKTQFLSNYFLRVAKVPAKINDAKGNPSPCAPSCFWLLVSGLVGTSLTLISFCPAAAGAARYSRSGPLFHL